MQTFFYLNVDGHNFQSSYDTIEKIPIFKAYFDVNPTSPHGKTPDLRLFLDRNFDLFQKIYMLFAYPDKKNEIDITYELPYYGIDESAGETPDETGGDNKPPIETSEQPESTQTPPTTPEDTPTPPSQSTPTPPTPPTPEELERIRLIEALAEFEVLNMVNNPNPYYVCACGTIFTTTKDRLMKARYFSAMFNFRENDKSIGTHDNPLYIEMSADPFKHLLTHLRNPTFELPNAYNTIWSVFLTLPDKDDKKGGNTYRDDVKHICSEGNGILTLAAYGPENNIMNPDASEPHVTIFKRPHKKHTHFSSTFITVDSKPSSSYINWDKVINFTISRKGDLMGSIYLVFSLSDYPSNTYCAYRILKHVSISIGNQIIDTLEGWLMWQEEMLFCKDPWVFNNNSKTLIVPLRLFNTYSAHNSLPLIALPYQEVNISITTSKCIDVFLLDGPKIESCSLDIKYYYLDTDERRYYAQNLYTNMIKQHQYETYFIHPLSNNTTIRIIFSHLIEMLVFTLHTDANDTFFCGYNNDPTIDPLISATITINGHIIQQASATHFRFIDKRESGLNTPDIPIYTHCFGLNMKKSMYKNQPAGTLNASRIDTISLQLNHKPDVKMIRVWGLNLNVFVAREGTGGLHFRR